ncbi:hypothetical protein EV401DRAFT_1884260 [Pisolithus croceorrhizus]|nr:hypothetical protein EV401DRAFT_1884260 [Pisolithus croceorrhizus]
MELWQHYATVLDKLNDKWMVSYCSQWFAKLCGKHIVNFQSPETAKQDPTSTSVGELEKQYAFTVAFMVYSSLKSKMKGKTSVPKEVKSIKIKELSFPLKVNNYLDFLQGILNKHGQDHYKVSERKWYSFKYVPPQD